MSEPDNSKTILKLHDSCIVVESRIIGMRWKTAAADIIEFVARGGTMRVLEMHVAERVEGICDGKAFAEWREEWREVPCFCPDETPTDRNAMNKPEQPTDPVLKALGKSSSELTFWAFRYFQGRMTGATCAFARGLARAWPHLEDLERNLIRKELEEAFQRDDEDRLNAAVKLGSPSILWLGHDCDRAAWEHVRAAWREFDETNPAE